MTGVEIGEDGKADDKEEGGEGVEGAEGRAAQQNGAAGHNGGIHSNGAASQSKENLADKPKEKFESKSEINTDDDIVNNVASSNENCDKEQSPKASLNYVTLDFAKETATVAGNDQNVEEVNSTTDKTKEQGMI